MATKTSQVTIDKILKLYKDGFSSTVISNYLGVSHSTVLRYARKAGINRSNSEAKKLQYLLVPTEPKAFDPNAVYGDSVGGYKTCPKCNQSLPADLDHFYKRTRSNGRAYLSSGCKDCVKNERRQYVKENPEKTREINRKSYIKHRDKQNKQRRERFANNPTIREGRRQKNRLYYRENSEELRLKKRAYVIENKEELRKSWKRYYQKNKEKYRFYGRNRKARAKGAYGYFTEQDVERLYEEQRKRCFWCKTSIADGYQVDHFLPLAKGGSNKPYNLVLACPTCNTSKGAKLPSEFFEYRKWLSDNEPFIQRKRAYIRQKMREHRDRMRQCRS